MANARFFPLIFVPLARQYGIAVPVTESDPQDLGLYWLYPFYSYVGIYLKRVSPLRPEDAFTEKALKKVWKPPETSLSRHSCILISLLACLNITKARRLTAVLPVEDVIMGNKRRPTFSTCLASEVVLPVDVALTALPLRCVTDRCAGGECDVEEENVRGDAARLHQTRLGSSEVRQNLLCCPVCEVNPRNKTRLPIKSLPALLALLCFATILKYSE